MTSSFFDAPSAIRFARGAGTWSDGLSRLQGDLDRDIESLQLEAAGPRASELVSRACGELLTAAAFTDLVRDRVTAGDAFATAPADIAGLLGQASRTARAHSAARRVNGERLAFQQWLGESPAENVFDSALGAASAFLSWLIGGGSVGVIPPAPAPPPADPGAGEHDSQPWYSLADDFAFEGVASTAATAADTLGYTNAARHLRHYLGNSGDVLEVDPTAIARDVPGFRSSVESQVNAQIDAVTATAIETGNFDTPIEFTSDWQGYYIGPNESSDWFYALGGVSHSVTGVVVVSDGPAPIVEVEYRYHVHDQYNWDTGKETNIGPVTISDEKMGELHTAGLAQEFRVEGSSPTIGADGPVVAPNPSPIDDVPVSDDRDGTRSDPARPGQTEGRVEGGRVR